jgi:hypothetical protein
MNVDSRRRITVDYPTSSSSEKESSEDNDSNIIKVGKNTNASSIELQDMNRELDSRNLNEQRNADVPLDTISHLRNDSRGLFTDINFTPQADKDDELQVFKTPSDPLIEQKLKKKKKKKKGSRKVEEMTLNPQ